MSHATQDCYCIMKKGSIHQEEITNINVSAPNIETPQHVKQILKSHKRRNSNNNCGGL